MSTLKEKKPAISLTKFIFESEKKPDIRYRVWKKLQERNEDQASIYWIGIIDLGKIDEKNSAAVHVSFLDAERKLHQDSDAQGYGAKRRNSIVRVYDFSSIKETLLRHKRTAGSWGCWIFNVFLMETIWKDGSSEIRLLPGDHSPDPNYGILTKRNEDWSNSPIGGMEHLMPSLHEDKSSPVIFRTGPYVP